MESYTHSTPRNFNQLDNQLIAFKETRVEFDIIYQAFQ